MILKMNGGRCYIDGVIGEIDIKGRCAKLVVDGSVWDIEFGEACNIWKLHFGDRITATGVHEPETDTYHAFMEIKPSLGRPTNIRLTK